MIKVKTVRDIRTFLKSKKTEFKLKLSCPDLLFKAIESLGGEILYDDEPMITNGWQWDWWQTATYKGIKLQLSGCGYYGDCEISKIEG